MFFLIAAGGLFGQPAAPAKKPLLVLLEGNQGAWQAECARRGWGFLSPWAESTGKPLDTRVKALETAVQAKAIQPDIDPQRVYLAGQGEGASVLFYVAARIPDVWAAAVAAGGSPLPAIDTNRLFAVNTTNVPVMWLSGVKEQQGIAQKLSGAGYNLEFHFEASASPDRIFEWLASHRKDEFPATVDCETGSPAFSRCYWIEVTKFDPAERNDVLDSSRIPAPVHAYLAAGPFGYDTKDSGPGVLVNWLPENYKGPLKLQDRIVAVGGKPLANAAEFTALMQQTTENKPVVVMVQRGGDRIRVETQIVVAPPEETVTARVQGKYLVDEKDIQIISRSIAAMQITVPPQWAPSVINWNGSDAVRADAPGCWLLTLHNEVAHGAKCP